MSSARKSLIYNGANHYVDGDPSLEPLSYQPGQALFDAEDPASCIARDDEPFLRARDVNARGGQVSNVCFAQSLVPDRRSGDLAHRRDAKRARADYRRRDSDRSRRTLLESWDL